MRHHISFVLNGKPRQLRDVDPAMTLLYYLRKVERLTGTKEGCAEGDCGACTVALSECDGGRLRHRAVNACILLLPMLEGCAITTVEHLSKDGCLHPAQRALIAAHGSQCGFCTPGFVMSLYVAYLSEPKPDRGRIDDLLAGNLCRCTGYGPIIRAAQAMYDLPRPNGDAEGQLRAAIAAVAHDDRVLLESDGRRFFSPASLDDLARLCLEHPDAVIVSGATDVGLWITKLHRDIRTFIHTGRVAELRAIKDDGTTLAIGAGATFSDLEHVFLRRYPDFGELVRRFSAQQVRNRATIGGNSANGSPIGDAAPALIALGARLVLRKGASLRTIPLESFFIGYNRQDRQRGELLQAIEVPIIGPDRLKCYKLSKRFDSDISAVCGCFNIAIDDGTVAEPRICYGGLAATPKRARHVEAALAGRPWTMATVSAALPHLERDFSPLDDLRGSAAYRSRAAKNLLIKYFHETQQPLSRTRLVGRAAAFA